MRLLPLPGVFKPHRDSLMLAESVRALAAGADVLDVCTGSGVVAITAAQAGARQVTAVDISRRAVLSVRLGAFLNGARVQARRGDLFAPVVGRRFDVIASNPPYVPSPSDALPHRGASRAWEGGARGRAFIDRICARAAEHLVPGGTLLLVQSTVCAEQETIDDLTTRGFHVRILAREPGGLGPLMRERAPMLRRRGLLSGDSEALVVVSARLP